MATKQKFRFDGKTSVLEDLCVDIVDCHHSTPTWTDRGRLVVRSFNIKNGRLHLDDCSYTDEETFYERIARSKPEPGDLIITREAPMGEVCIIPDGVECCLGQRMVLIKPDRNKVDPKYLLYALQSEFVQKQIKKSDKTGSIVSNLRIPVLRGLLIPSFDVETEGQIGSVLDSLVSKIELNNRINVELEAMAKTIYDYWFVQFDFPISKEQAKAMGKPKLEGKPYKASGGKMVWNDELKREIPGGWEAKELREVTEVSNDSLNPMASPDVEYKHYSIPTFDSTGTYGIEKGKDIKSNKFIIRKSDILVSKLNPWFSRVIYAESENDLISSTEFVVWRTPNQFIKNYLYQIAKGEQFIEHCTQSASGTSNSHKRVNPDVMMRFIIPHNSEIAERFGEFVDPIVKKLINNKKENKKLSELRDWLLPILMNGQLKIKETTQSKVVKPTLPVSKPTNSYFYQTQLVAAIVNASKKHKITHGEMTLAKYTYLVDKLYGVPTYFNYERLHLGPYPKEMKKIVNNKKFFKIQNNEVSVVPQEKEYNYQFQKQVEEAVADLASIFNQYKGQERSRQTELLATVCKVVEDIKSTDLKAVRESMKNWPIDLKTSKFKNKAEKFSEEDVKAILTVIAVRSWKLVK